MVFENARLNENIISKIMRIVCRHRVWRPLFLKLFCQSKLPEGIFMGH